MAHPPKEYPIRAGLGRVAWAAAFIPTVVGSDTYVAELW
jgi:hypothetical protein